jgi:sugar O-acyltransferase (sialic acid O-acetyltransferase NeuD family)
LQPQKTKSMDNPVLIFGTGGLGRAALEIFESNGNVVYGFLDDDKKTHNTEIDNIQVLGKTTDDGFLKLIGQKCEAFIASDDNAERKSLVKMLLKKRKVMPVNAVHKSSVIASSAKIGHGNFFNGGTVVGAGTDIANHCILHSKSVVDHDSSLGDFVQLGAGSVVGPHVTVEEGVFIGAGAVLVAGITIGKNARIGAGSVVVSDVEANATLFGNPAQEIEK